MDLTAIKRREFLKSMGLISAGTYAAGMGAFSFGSCQSAPTFSKREAVLNMLTATGKQDYIPSGFFVHFGKGYQWGDAAVARHLEYFKAIDMDFIKIQYEALFPAIDIIKKPEDWARMPFYKKDYYEEQLYVVKELVKQGKKLAPVIATFYSPFMCAGHSVTSQLVTEHLKQDPESVKKGLEIITDSVLIFLKECKKLGVDGFLAPTQGNEAFRFQDPNIFLDYIKPTDMVVQNEINEGCICNVLHICDYEGPYDDLSPFVDYPGHIVNLSDIVAGKKVPLKQLYEMFGKRPIMGGLEKRGPILTGTDQEIQAQVKEVLEEAPERFILGAECALLGEVDWKKVRTAVNTGHLAAK
jgi:uroporphyrinogen decarboxylase